jgi:ATP/maltotriose-dependent transcriptional regulator MalT
VTLAVELDIAQGRIGKAFDRMAAMGGATQALELLGAHGQTMIFRGQGTTIARFIREHPDLMEADRRTWMPAAVQFWLSGDISQACYWLDRRTASGLDKLDPVDNACAALMRSRLGLESVDEAVDRAQQLTRHAGGALASRSVAGFAHLLVELGATENWTGQLEDAEQSLMAAIGLAEAHGLELISAMGASNLAFTKYLSGHEHAAGVIASQALDTLARLPRSLGQFTAASAALAVTLVRLVDAPWLARDEFEWTPRALHPADLNGRFWSRSCLSQLRVRDGKLAAAEQAIELPLDLPVVDELPPHLLARLLLERAGLATLSGNEEMLRTSSAGLRDIDRVGEALLVDGLGADLVGDSQRAVELFGAAADALHGAPLWLRSFALTCRSQLLDALGDQEAALLGIREAVSETAVSRNAMSFLGWTRYGTPMQTLLGRFAAAPDGPWMAQIIKGMSGRVDLTAAFLLTAPTARERASAGSTLVQPKLSPRELDVLRGLARGSTYSDIGAELFLSENTIKTHVSNLYAKLGVSRRSDALSVGRGLNLL